MSLIREKKYAVMLDGLRITDYIYDDVIQTTRTLYGIKHGMKNASVIHAYSKEDGSVLFKMEYVEYFSYTENVMTIKLDNQRWYVYFDSCQKVKGPFSNVKISNGNIIVSRKTERIVGYMEVSKSVFGMFNEEGLKILPIKYDDIELKSEGLIEVVYKHKYGLVNSEGKWIIKPIYDDIEFYDFDETLIECWSRDDKSYGLFDIEGNVVFPCKYFKINIDFEKHLIYVWNKEQLWGIYNLNADMVFPEVSPSIYVREHTIEVNLNMQTLVYIPVLNLFLPKEDCFHHKNYLKYFHNGKWHKLWYDNAN